MSSLRKWLRTPFPYKRYRYSAVLVIICINAGFFVFQRFFSGNFLDNFLALNSFLVVKKGYLWTVVTYMFVHKGFSHLLFNMLGLYFFGIAIEHTWGSDEFVFCYFLFGIVSGIVSVFLYMFLSAFNIFLIGASGAVFGIMLVFACLYPHSRMYVFGIFPMSTRVFMLLYIALQILSLGDTTRTGVAYLTHLVGIAIAWLYMIIRHNINPYTRLFRK